jgi:hypothetical protein
MVDYGSLSGVFDGSSAGADDVDLPSPPAHFFGNFSKQTLGKIARYTK